MAALRHGISTVIIPAENEKDMAEIDQTVRKSLNFITAQTVETVLDAALNRNTQEAMPAILNKISEDRKSTNRKPGIRQ